MQTNISTNITNPKIYNHYHKHFVTFNTYRINNYSMLKERKYVILPIIKKYNYYKVMNRFCIDIFNIKNQIEITLYHTI